MSAQSTPALSATPNPVPRGSETTRVTWDVGDRAGGRVAVSVDGRDEALFAAGARGTATADWIKPGSTYEFRLYHDGRATPLASVTVSQGGRWTPSVSPAWIVGGLAALLLFTYRRRVRLAGAGVSAGAG